MNLRRLNSFVSIGKKSLKRSSRRSTSSASLSKRLSIRSLKIRSNASSGSPMIHCSVQSMAPAIWKHSRKNPSKRSTPNSSNYSAKATNAGQLSASSSFSMVTKYFVSTLLHSLTRAPRSKHSPATTMSMSYLNQSRSSTLTSMLQMPALS